MTDRISLSCSGGYTLHTDGETIIIAKGESEEVIPVSAIQSISLKEPGAFYGRIEFTTAQPASGGIGIGFGIIAAFGVQKTFRYSVDYHGTAIQFRDVVVNYNKPTSQPAPAPAGTVVSVVEEIRGLKALLDDGILTHDEFEAKKKQLLGI